MGLDMSININGDEAYYMRKHNAVRKWFADHLENFEDNGTTRIYKEDFEAILRDMKYVITNCGLEVFLDNYIKYEDYGLSDEDYDPIKEYENFVKNGGIRYKLFCEIANGVFPSSSGFFFGSTAYNEWYISDLIHDYCEFLKLYNTEIDWDNDVVEYWEWY